ncbi:ATP-binding protein [Bdellovibrionota bacterium FG-1]
MGLTSYNDWWKSGGLWQDVDLKRVKDSSLFYRPLVFSEDDCQPAAVYTLRGPRRAGKTVCLKLLIAQLIESKKWNPQTIVWTNLETIKNMAEMESHLDVVLAHHAPRLLVIDEVTSVVGWQRVIKKAVDAGRLADTTVILTGSSAYDLKKGAERMAGRRGTYQSPDRILLPMDYREFAHQLTRCGVKPSPELFFQVGGFPFRVEEFLKNPQDLSRLEPSTQVFDDIIAYEFNRRKLDRNIALEVIGRLSSVGAHAISYEAFSKNLSVSRDTARKYLDALGDSYLLMTFSSFDTGRGRVAPRKDRKFHWVDPSLAYLASWLRVGEPPLPEALAEYSVGSALIRELEPRLWEGLASPKQVYTWKSKAGKEIDFLWVDRSIKMRFPIEVNFQDSVSDWDFQSIEQGFGKGILVTRCFSKNRPNAKAISLKQFLLNPALPQSQPK